MGRRIRLLTGRLHYGPEVELHTASSGPVAHLEETYLALEQDGELCGLGAVRTNIAYLTGIPASAINADARAWAGQTDWSRSAEGLLEELDCAVRLSAPVRALFDQCLHDALARHRGLPLCGLLGARWQGEAGTNQTLFWSDDEVFLQRAERYVERGFLSLKVRIAVGDFERDLARLKLLRDRFGADVTLSADANGRWSGDDARRKIAALAPFALDYIEQPVAADDWQALGRLAQEAPMAVMLDESLSSPEDVQRLIDIGGCLAGHLKLVKCGGVGPLMAAARRLSAAGVRVMVGQMNEGAVATAAAAHCALALKARDNELYGADGLHDDPAQGLSYSAGKLKLPRGPGLGLDFNPANLTPIWEHRL